MVEKNQIIAHRQQEGIHTLVRATALYLIIIKYQIPKTYKVPLNGEKKETFKGKYKGSLKTPLCDWI